uniref:Xylosyltransferase 2 n=1 Tax=Aegilops tauschii TaxID=37682 RepID=M8BJD6_AEGTA
MDLRCVLCVAAGALFAVFLLGASWIAFPSASFFLLQYSPATQRAPPRFAYLISGSAGDAGRLRRCLLALYHPRNHYILHLDAEAPDSDRTGLAAFVAAHPVVAAVGNVRVVEKANLVTYRGITMVTTTLHATAIFLRGPGADWDWFINLSASDYSLVTQDGRFRFSTGKHSCFHHCIVGIATESALIVLARPARVMPVVVDRGLYMKTKQDLLWMNETEKRELPTAFTLFTGMYAAQICPLIKALSLFMKFSACADIRNSIKLYS